MQLRSRRSRAWPRLLFTAAASSAATLFIARNFFPSEKKIRHRIQAEYAVGEAVFERVMGQLLGPPLVSGNQIEVLRNGQEIFPSMLAAIGKARHTISFENFLWREGRIANQIADALAQRSREGVKVYLLQDAFGCNAIHGRSMNKLRAAGVNLEIFRSYLISRINFRTHRKLLVVDGRIGFIGGVCICDAWDGDGTTRGHWRDMHYRVEGPAVAQIQQAFLDNWMQTRGQVLHGEDFFPALEERGSIKCQTFRSSAGDGSDSARLMFLLSIAAARKRIRLATAFFLPDDLMIRTLVEARARGVEIDIIVPGPDNDSPIVRWAGRSRWRPLLKAGVRFWEYQPARFHCKYMLVDDCWCSVGSTNIDHRSLRLNEEANLNILDSAFCSFHEAIFQKDRENSRQIDEEDWLRRPGGEKILGGLAALARLQM